MIEVSESKVTLNENLKIGFMQYLNLVFSHYSEQFKFAITRAGFVEEIAE